MSKSEKIMQQFMQTAPKNWRPELGEEVLLEHWLPEIRPKYSKGVVRQMLPPDLYRVDLIDLSDPEFERLDFLLHQLRPKPEKLLYLRMLEKQEAEQMEKVREQMCLPSTF